MTSAAIILDIKNTFKEEMKISLKCCLKWAIIYSNKLTFGLNQQQREPKNIEKSDVIYICICIPQKLSISLK